MSRTLQQLFAWSGVIFSAVILLCFLVMGFLPPLSPAMSAAEIFSAFEANRTGIRVGATVMMQASLLGVLWATAISLQIRRIEHPLASTLAYAQLALGALVFVLIVPPCVMWTVAAFRPERDAELVLMLNDIAWLGLLMPVFPAVLQAIVIGVAVSLDQRTQPLFPRWAAYFNGWCAVLFLPGALATFFKTGPFAWDGLFDFWLPIPIFVAWIVLMGWLTAKAIDKP